MCAQYPIHSLIHRPLNRPPFLMCLESIPRFVLLCCFWRFTGPSITLAGLSTAEPPDVKALCMTPTPVLRSCHVRRP